MYRQILDNYCERAGDPAFWAEPLNALTNAAFLIAGLLILFRLAAGRPRDDRALSWFLAIMMVVIGVGSFLFHTLATRWSAMADVLPILVFILAGLFGVVRRGFGQPLWLGLLALPLYFGLVFVSMRLGGAMGIGGGVLGYGPALLVLFGSGALMQAQGRPGGGMLLAAGAVFALSLTLRTLDKPYCDTFTLGDWTIGTHWLWHLLNAVTLYLVAAALIWRAGKREIA